MTRLPPDITAPRADPPHPLDAHTLRPLFHPRGVLVVGASADATKLGGAMAASLASYPGHLALVNARGGEGQHTSVAGAVDAASVPLDLAVLCVPAPACADVVTEVGAAGVGAALVCAGGFGEAGGEGVEHQRRLVAAARCAGVRLLGPNTSGFFAPRQRLIASFVPGVAGLEPGPVGLVAASGGLNHAVAFALQRVGSGLTFGVGIGAGLDIAAPEVLDYLALDPMTTAIALHLEHVGDGEALLTAVSAASRRKPIVAMVVGRHDVEDFARSHTGALATSWRTTRGLLRQAGAVLADDVDELVTAVSVLARTRSRPHPDPGAALVTAQAGPGLVIADALHEAGVRLPTLGEATRHDLGTMLPPLTFQANPVDTGRPGPRHADIVETVARDPQVDVVAVYGLTEPVVDLVAAAEQARHTRVPVVVGIDGPAGEIEPARAEASAAGTPFVVGTRALTIGVAALVEDAILRYRLDDDDTGVSDGESVDRLPAGGLTEARAKDLLDELGLHTPPRRVCHTADEARVALRDLGGPVAVKVSDAGIVHKSDVGGVRLGIVDRPAMDRAFADLCARPGPDGPEVLVERMVDPGVDLLVAARRDAVFGPVVVVGLGGVATEVYADVAIAAVPATRSWLAGLADDLAARALLDGHRGRAGVDRKALGEVLTALGDLLLAHPEVDEIEVNPLRSSRDGLVALDAVVLVADRHPPRSSDP